MKTIGYKFKSNCKKFYWINQTGKPNELLEIIEKIKRCKN